MAGRARQHALTEELAKRTSAMFEDEGDKTALDYVCARIEGGTTTKELAEELAQATGYEIDYAFMMRRLRATFGDEATESAIDSARVRASHCFADEAKTIVDAEMTEQVEVSRAALRVKQRNWAAERYNPSKYGQAKGVSVNVSIGSLHLDALRAVPARLSTLVTGTEVQQLPGPSHNTEDEAQVVRTH